MGYVEDLRGKVQGRGRPRWRARYRDPSGRERSKSFVRKVDAERFLVGVEDAKLRGAYVDPQLGRVTFGEWAERWYRTTADLKPASRRTYRKLLDNQVLPAFGRATLAGIDTLSVREWVAGLVDQGLSPSRVRNAHQVLSQVLAAGVEGGRIARNSAAGVRLPRVVRREMHFLAARQVEDLAVAIDPRYGLLVRFAAYTGLRAGELVALRVRHLNLLRGRCEVAESATEIDGRLVWGTTKTYARRTVHLPRFLCDQLAGYLAERPHGPDDLVFTAPQGGPLREQKFVAGFFKPAAARVGLPRLRFHDLRHTCASLLIARGASVKAVQAQLGHASATVTLDRYGHLFPDELQQLAVRLQEVYADAVTDPARTERASAAVQRRKEAGQ
ncbi:MAG TPA: tyrosine-type recombinase/integrase [Actinomycetes bacterium]|nr:tyrosine-type recombinase/integrase [Actinomycetes bacterium]